MMVCVTQWLIRQVLREDEKRGENIVVIIIKK